MILKFRDFYESLGVVVKVKRDRDNGYQVAESVMGVGQTGLLSTMAVHVTEGSDRPSALQRWRRELGLRTWQPSAHSCTARV